MSCRYRLRGGTRSSARRPRGYGARPPAALLQGDPHQRARWLAARSGLDATAIWQWGVIERVSTGLLCTKIELQPVGRQMLAAADRVVE
jgi:streptomycin 6-kinase